MGKTCLAACLTSGVHRGYNSDGAKRIRFEGKQNLQTKVMITLFRHGRFQDRHASLYQLAKTQSQRFTTAVSGSR